jgi:hypothetical protein
MKRLMTIPMGILAVLLMVTMWLPSTKASNELRRLAADPLYFVEFQEAVTNMEPPGIAIYEKTVFVPRGVNALYLTMSTTGDTHGGAAGCFTAKVDGAFFNPGGQGAARCANHGTTGVPGWVTLVKLPDSGTNCNDGGGGGGDCHDNSINYQWCTPIRHGPHTLQVRMASSSAGKNVFIEQAFFYVDASRIKKGSACGAPSRDDDDDEHDGERDR